METLVGGTSSASVDFEHLRVFSLTYRCENPRFVFRNGTKLLIWFFLPAWRQVGGLSGDTTKNQISSFVPLNYGFLMAFDNFPPTSGNTRWVTSSASVAFVAATSGNTCWGDFQSCMALRVVSVTYRYGIPRYIVRNGTKLLIWFFLPEWRQVGVEWRHHKKPNQ